MDASMEVGSLFDANIMTQLLCSRQEDETDPSNVYGEDQQEIPALESNKFKALKTKIIATNELITRFKRLKESKNKVYKLYKYQIKVIADLEEANRNHLKEIERLKSFLESEKSNSLAYSNAITQYRARLDENEKSLEDAKEKLRDAEEAKNQAKKETAEKVKTIERLEKRLLLKESSLIRGRKKTVRKMSATDSGVFELEQKGSNQKIEPNPAYRIDFIASSDQDTDSSQAVEDPFIKRESPALHKQFSASTLESRSHLICGSKNNCVASVKERKGQKRKAKEQKSASYATFCNVSQNIELEDKSSEKMVELDLVDHVGPADDMPAVASPLSSRVGQPDRNEVATPTTPSCQEGEMAGQDQLTEDEEVLEPALSKHSKSVKKKRKRRNPFSAAAIKRRKLLSRKSSSQVSASASSGLESSDNMPPKPRSPTASIKKMDDLQVEVDIKMHENLVHHESVHLEDSIGQLDGTGIDRCCDSDSDSGVITRSVSSNEGKSESGSNFQNRDEDMEMETAQLDEPDSMAGSCSPPSVSCDPIKMASFGLESKTEEVEMALVEDLNIEIETLESSLVTEYESQVDFNSLVCEIAEPLSPLPSSPPKKQTCGSLLRAMREVTMLYTDFRPVSPLPPSPRPASNTAAELTSDSTGTDTGSSSRPHLCSSHEVPLLHASNEAVESSPTSDSHVEQMVVLDESTDVRQQSSSHSDVTAPTEVNGLSISDSSMAAATTVSMVTSPPTSTTVSMVTSPPTSTTVSMVTSPPRAATPSVMESGELEDGEITDLEEECPKEIITVKDIPSEPSMKRSVPETSSKGKKTKKPKTGPSHCYQSVVWLDSLVEQSPQEEAVTKKGVILRGKKQKTSQYVLNNLKRLASNELTSKDLVEMFGCRDNIPAENALLSGIKLFLKSYKPSWPLFQERLKEKHQCVISTFVKSKDSIPLQPCEDPQSVEFVPCLLPLEARLVWVVLNLTKIFQEHSSREICFLFLFKKELLELIQKEDKFHTKCALVRLYVASCRLLHCTKDEVRMLCCNILEGPGRLMEHKLPLIQSAASIWPESLTCSVDPGQICKNDKYIPASLEQDMLIHVPETLVAQMIWKDNPDNFNSMAYRTLYLFCRWRYYNENILQSVALGLVTVLNTSTKIGLQKPTSASSCCHGNWRRPQLNEHTMTVLRLLMLACGVVGWPWTSDVLIRTRLWPLLQAWSKKDTSVTVTDVTVGWICSFIGMVGRIGIDYSKTNKQHTSSLIQLQKLLISLIQKACNNQEISLIIQLTAVDSLLILCQHVAIGNSESFEALKAWYNNASKHQLIPKEGLAWYYRPIFHNQGSKQQFVQFSETTY